MHAGCAHLLVGFLQIAAAEAIGSVPDQPLRTAFGTVHVDARHRAAAIEEGDAARQAAETVLGLKDVRFNIVDGRYAPAETPRRSRTTAPTYAWQFAPSTDGRSVPPPAFLLRHEIGHDLFMRHLVGNTRADQYGSDAPDWLDEMAAVAFESEALKTGRRRVVVEHLRRRDLIPLERFLHMTHPEHAAGAIPSDPGSNMRAFEAKSADTLLFYGMTLAFYDYMVARSGSARIIADLAPSAPHGERLLRQVLRRAIGRDASGGIAGMERDFHTWLTADHRYGSSQSR